MMEALLGTLGLALLYAIWEGREINIGLQIGPKSPKNERRVSPRRRLRGRRPR